MLAMTKKTGYGLIAMTHLAKIGPEKLASAREIAEEYDVPVALLMNVLKELATEGFVQSVRGAHGGYRIARNPDEVNFIELMEVLEGPMRLAECVINEVGDGRHSKCRIMDKCPIADPVHRVHRKIYDFLSDLTLADVLLPTKEEAMIFAKGRA